MELCSRLTELEYRIAETDDPTEIRRLLEEYEKMTINLLSQKGAIDYVGVISEAINALKREISNLDDPDTRTDWHRELQFVFNSIGEICGEVPVEILPYGTYQKLKELTLKYSTVPF